MKVGEIVPIFLKTRKNKPKRKKIGILKIIKLLLLAVLGGIIYSMGVTTYENIKVIDEIEAFKARAEFKYDEVVFNRFNVEQRHFYYEVPRETSYELADMRDVFYDEERLNLGQKGDIFVTRQSPFPFIPGFHQFMTLYFGGHAAIHDGNNRFIEATGFPNEDESLWDIIRHPGNEEHNFSVSAALNTRNIWLLKGYRPTMDTGYPYYGSFYRKEFIGLRVKNITEEQIDGAVDFGLQVIENRYMYNFLFFLDMEYKFYCTDLVSRAYQHVMVEPDKQHNYARALNDDRFITSVNDLILSRETYIHFYVEVVGEDEDIHIYYLA
jgi:hypothetical protein